MLRVGVIGMRAIGNRHAEVYYNHPQAELVAVCDIIKERADKAAERFGCKAYYTVADMLANEELDAADVCTGGEENGSDHYEPTMQCFEAGLHVLCEKPISNNIQEAREMVAKAKEKGLCFGINLNHRFTPQTAKAKEWLDAGDIGELCFVNMALWIGNPKDSEWFHLRALHPHSIDVMRYFAGSVESVSAFCKRSAGRTCWSNVQMNILFKNGVVGHLVGSYDMTTRHPMERCELGGTKGRILLENVYETLWYFPHDSDECRYIHNSIFGGLSGFGDTFRLRISRWIEQVDGGASPEEIEASGEDGLEAQEVIEAAIKSWQTRSVVNLSDL